MPKRFVVVALLVVGALSFLMGARYGKSSVTVERDADVRECERALAAREAPAAQRECPSGTAASGQDTGALLHDVPVDEAELAVNAPHSADAGIDPEHAAAVGREATRLLEEAISRRAVSATDREVIAELLPQMSPQDRAVLTRRAFDAMRDGGIRFEPSTQP